MGLVIEFDCVMDVLYHLFFDFPVGFDQVKKLGAVMHVFCFNDGSLVSFHGFVVPCFLSQRSLSAVAGQIFCEIVARPVKAVALRTVPLIITAMLAIEEGIYKKAFFKWSG